MTEREYNEAEGIRRSDLWRMADSPEKYKYFLENPQEQTPSMAFGSACHKMILEPDTFGDEYAVAPQVDRRTKDGKAQWEAFIEDNAGKTIISADDAAVMEEMETALVRCPLAKELLWGKGSSEVPVFWTDPETGEKCKVKLDRLLIYEGQNVVVDYKTATSAQTEKFNRSVFNFGYALQAAMYTEALLHNGEVKRPRFIFVVQEKKAPYSVNVVEVSPEVMEFGMKQYRTLLDRLHTCKELDEWPGYLPIDGGTNWTDLPAWVDEEEEEA